MKNDEKDAISSDDGQPFSKTMSLSKFIKAWRSAFLSEMKPQNLPKGWQVDHLTIRTFGKNSKFYEGE